ncbi:MAG: SGNH/GDSL hydrolase family protein [Candidatus Krumholzibacteriota bacterium]|nr:SGNH/GDSL hydrolase family protein [Candidatus Krumholzibacteriota bacterium]
MATQGLRGSRGAKVGLVIFGCVIGLVVCEIIVRVAGIEPRINILFRENFRLSENPVLKYELQPGSRDGDLRISSAGLRDREFDRPKPVGTYRIGIIGDSIAYGLRCTQPEAFARQLDELLAAAGADATRFEVLNFGVSGYDITQVVERLRTLGMSFDLDLVIYAYSLNDPQSFSLELQGLTAMHDQVRRHAKPRDTLRRWLSHSRIFLLLWQASQQRAWQKQARPGRQSPDYEAVVRGEHVAYFEGLHNGASWEKVQRELSALATLTGGVGTPPRTLVAVFPVFLGSSATYPLSDLHRRILAEAEQQGLEALDLAPSYSIERYANVEPFFIDPFHPTPLGHRVTAYALLAWLKSAGILDGPAYEKILGAHRIDRGIYQH